MTRFTRESDPVLTSTISQLLASNGVPNSVLSKYINRIDPFIRVGDPATGKVDLYADADELVVYAPNGVLIFSYADPELVAKIVNLIYRVLGCKEAKCRVPVVTD